MYLPYKTGFLKGHLGQFWYEEFDSDIETEKKLIINALFGSLLSVIQ